MARVGPISTDAEQASETLGLAQVFVRRSGPPASGTVGGIARFDCTLNLWPRAGGRALVAHALELLHGVA